MKEMKRLGLIILMVFAVAIFYESCGDTSPQERFEKAVERTSDRVKEKAKEEKRH